MATERFGVDDLHKVFTVSTSNTTLCTMQLQDTEGNLPTEDSIGYIAVTSGGVYNINLNEGKGTATAMRIYNRLPYAVLAYQVAPTVTNNVSLIVPYGTLTTTVTAYGTTRYIVFT